MEIQWIQYPSRNQIVIDPATQRQDRNDSEIQRNLLIKQLAVHVVAATTQCCDSPRFHIYLALSVTGSPF